MVQKNLNNAPLSKKILPNHVQVEPGTTTVTEVKLHYFRGHGSTMAVAVKNFSSISE